MTSSSAAPVLKADLERAQALLVQRWVELLNLDADVSRRVRTLSVRTAVGEATALARSKVISEGVTRAGEDGEGAGHGIRNLPDVVDEAIGFVKADRVLFVDNKDYVEQAERVLSRLKETGLSEHDVLAAGELAAGIQKAFLTTAFARLRAIFERSPKNLQDLDSIVGGILAELRALGWSDEALRRSIQPLTSGEVPAGLTLLETSLTSKPRRFLCRVPVELGGLSGDLPVKLDGILVESGRLTVTWEALDPESAARGALESVTTLLGAASVFLEGDRVDVARGKEIEVQADGESEWQSINPAIPLPREHRIAVEGQIERVMTSVWEVRRETLGDPVFDAVRFYDRAAATSDPETRFVLLWFGLERLVSGSLDHRGSIEGAVRALIPKAVTLAKIRREVSALCAALLRDVDASTKDKLLAAVGIKHPITDELVVDREKVLSALMADQAQYESFTALFYNSSVLLAQWAHKLRKVFGPEDHARAIDGPVGQRVTNYVEASRIRVERQVLRLYRARNGLAHAGLRPSLVHDIITHAAFYLTNLVAIAVTYREHNPKIRPSRIYAQRCARYDLFLELLRRESALALNVPALMRPRSFAW